MNSNTACFILGIRIGSVITTDSIKNAYKQKSLIYHPDRVTGDKAMFIRVKDAYDFLIIHIQKEKTTWERVINNIIQKEQHDRYVYKTFIEKHKNLIIKIKDKQVPQEAVEQSLKNCSRVDLGYMAKIFHFKSIAKMKKQDIIDDILFVRVNYIKK